jgi:E3 ubiquitin-protein ligase TRIP12
VTVGEKEFIFHEEGLFPLPLMEWTNKDTAQICEHFNILGRLVSKAIVDEQLVNIPFSTPFFKAVLGHPFTFQDLCLLRPAMGEFLRKLASSWREGTGEKVLPNCN